ncbi:MAG: hypothetical protein AAB515_01850 [Patescibacteria group bacterium]
MAQQVLSQLAMGELAAINSRDGFSPELFGSLARLTPQVAVETVALRQGSNNTIEVYMIQRPDDEPAYPGEKHSPGSILRNSDFENIDPCSDGAYRRVIDRLAKREFHVGITNFDLVGEIFFEEERGSFNNRIFLVELDGEPTGGAWYDIDNLPENTIDHHWEHIIPIAVAAYRKRRTV